MISLIQNIIIFSKDFIDVKVDKLVDNIQMKGITHDVMRLYPVSIMMDSFQIGRKTYHTQIMNLGLRIF
jgi:hypothetical protein